MQYLWAILAIAYDLRVPLLVAAGVLAGVLLAGVAFGQPMPAEMGAGK